MPGLPAKPPKRLSHSFLILGARKPSTRDVADTVKRGGTEALTSAQQRADHARYQEVTCRSALNRVQGMPFEWTLNPYRGCTHGCHYCFARRYHVQFEMNADDEFASVILANRNIVDVLRASSIGRRGPARSSPSAPPPIRTSRLKGIQADERVPRSAHIGTDADWFVTKGPMIVRDRGRPARREQRARMHRSHERSDGRRRCLARSRTGHRPSNSAYCARFESGRRRDQCGRLMAPSCLDSHRLAPSSSEP